MADASVVLLNDTDVEGYHFGCARVMSIIRDQLAHRNLKIAGSVPVGVDWRLKHADIVQSADLLVINGEGTLHHGSRKGRWLLEAGNEAKSRGARVALINALWQDNPSDWPELVSDFDVLACRDSRSALALSTATGRDIRFMGDLSMTAPAFDAPEDRSGVVIGDSVHASVTERLATLARELPAADLLPVTSSLKFVSPHLTGLRRAARAWYARLKQRRYLKRNPSARFLPDERAYISALQTKALSVTGRFHAVCLATVARTPIVAVASNSWKIEALIEDLGLQARRQQPLSALNADSLAPEDWAFTKDELRQIDSRLAEWAQAADALFDDIAALVHV